MDPLEYVEEIVRPTMAEFQANPRSRRHAYLACMVVFHIKDHLKKAGEKGIEDKMRKATRATSAFDVVRGICNGAKHVETTPDHRIPFKAGDEFDRPPARAGEMEFGKSRLGDAVGGREFQIGPDPDRDRMDIYNACEITLSAFCVEYPRLLPRGAPPRLEE
jgi:hypothetical protein